MSSAVTVKTECGEEEPHPYRLTVKITMSVCNNRSSQDSVTSQYRVVVILISSDEEGHDKVKATEALKGPKLLDRPGPSGIKPKSAKPSSFDPVADLYYDGKMKNVISSKKRTSTNSSGMNKRSAVLKDVQPIIILSSSDESSG